MSLKKLNLDQGKVEEILDAHRKKGTLIDDSVKGNGRHCNFLIDGKACLVIFFFKKDGTTTIQTTAGPDSEMSERIGNEIKEAADLSQTSQASYTFRNISTDQVVLFQEYVEEEIEGANVSTTKVTDSQSRITLEGRYKDKATVTYYESTGTVLLQGKPLPIIQEAKLFFYDIADIDDIIENESNVHEIKLEKDALHGKLHAYMPNAISFLDNKIIKILTPALVLESINVDLPDYSMFVYPALRGMEGYIRQLLKAKYPEYRNTNKIGSLFDDCIKGDGFPLQGFAQSSIGCTDTICALETAYTKYHTLRHPYFHIDKHISSAPIIERKDAALSLTMDVLTTIESTYTPLIAK